MAPVKKPIDWKQFEKLCSLQCTQSEMGSFFRMHADTLRDRVVDHYGEEYATVYKNFAEEGKCSLRRSQFLMALKTPSMAIWLGKHWLGQRDVSREDVVDIAQELLNGLKELAGEPRVAAIKQSVLEAQQSILDQGCPGQQDKV